MSVHGAPAEIVLGLVPIYGPKSLLGYQGDEESVIEPP